MVLQFFEIPTIPSPQSFSISLKNVVYNMTLIYRGVINDDTGEQIGGWVLDLADTNSVPLVAGIPLVTGADLLAQYEYLAVGGSLIVLSDTGMWDVPTFDGMGSAGHLYFAFDDGT